jgi:hypothetical protein
MKTKDRIAKLQDVYDSILLLCEHVACRECYLRQSVSGCIRLVAHDLLTDTISKHENKLRQKKAENERAV